MTSNKHRVLIVDDEPVVRRILRQRLSAEGYMCQEAGRTNATGSGGGATGASD
jgi:DNA-binding response OmpR family regulator